MKKKLFYIPVAIVIILTIAIVAATNGLSSGSKIAINGINLADIEDGNYTGTYDYKRWSNTLVVQVENQNIISISIKKDVTAAGVTNCADEVFRRVIEKQDTKIDAVSGATVTTKAYLKAIEDALK